MIKPTREEVEKWKYESAHSPLHDHAFENHNRLIYLADAYFAQGEELEQAVKEAAKWRRIRKPTHGPCCTCQGCGLHHDECRCDLDEVCDELDQLKAENQALKEELKEIQRFVIHEHDGGPYD